MCLISWLLSLYDDYARPSRRKLTGREAVATCCVMPETGTPGVNRADGLK